MFNKKILCVGNETELTDQLTSTLAVRDSTVNHGLVTTDTFSPSEFWLLPYQHSRLAGLVALFSIWHQSLILL
jgi:hypothetical protein